MVRLSKLEAIGHFDNKKIKNAVYSVDFQPDGHRLATSGGDGTVKLWDMKHFTQSKGSTGSNEYHPTTEDLLLATIETHNGGGSVNVCRWSPCGQLLALGDDRYILVFRQNKGAIPTNSFGSLQPKNKENWVRHCTLQGHSMDILDLDWGPLTTGVSGVCNLCLASASIDNTVMVWHVPAIPAASGANGGRISRHPAKPSSSMLTPSHTLHGHTSFVKGCSFDPIGKYLATCGADNVVIMWDCATWTECSTVSEPLSNSPDRTQFRRLSWAPDGSALCLSACSKSNKPVGSVLRRPGSAGGDWLGVADLVGHNSQSTCTRFCPYLLQQQEEVVNTGDVGGTAGVENVPASAARSRRTTRASASPTSPGARGGLAQPVCCVVGMGDQDGVISIWSTHSKVPTLVIQDCFAGAVTDVSWHKSGAPYTVKEQMMCAASLDGTILLVEFHHSAQSKCEIGTEVSDITSDAHYTQLYGVTRSVLLGGLSNSSDNRHTIDGGGGNVVRGRAVVDPVLRQFLNSKTTAVVGSNSDTHQPSNGIVHTTHHNHDSSGEPSFNTVLRTGPVSTESVTSAVAGTVVIGRQDESSQDNDSGAMSAVEAEDMNAQPSAFLSQATTDQLDTRPANTEQEHRMAGKRLLSSQKTSRSGNGKRRICPVLVAVGDDATIDTLPSEVVALDSNVSGAIGGGIGAGGGSGMEMNSIRHGNGGSKGAPSTAALATSVTTTVRNSGMAFQSTQPLQHMQESLQHRMVSKRIDPISASISYRRSTATHPEATSEQFPIIPTALFTVHFEQDGLTCCSLPYQYSNLQSNSSDGDVNACKISVVVRTNVVGDRGAMDTEAGAMGLIHASPLYQLALSPLEVTKVKSSNTAACTETTGCYSSLSLIGLNGTDHLWDVVVPGCGICISGILDHNTSSTEPLDHTQDTGVCVVGCLDGSVHVYSIHQAIRLLPPMVMGSPISFIDIRSDGGGAAAGKVVYTLMVVCSNGDVCVWQLSQHLSDSVVASTALPFMSPLKCTLLYKTSVLIAMRSLKLQHAPSTSSTSPMANASPNLTHTHGKSSGQSTMNTSSSSCPMQFNVQQCSLTLENDCLITISTSIGPDSSNANKPKDKASGRHGYSGMRNAEDSGVLHTYQYSQAMHCFMCLSSVHTSLKRLFSNPYTGEQKISHIAEIARHILDGAGSRDNNRHYIAAMIHLNDIEEKISLCRLSLNSSSTSSNKIVQLNVELDKLMNEWITFCCKSGFVSRVRWYVQMLLSCIPPIGDIGSGSLSSSCREASQDVNQDISSTIGSTTRQKATHILEDIVLPVLTSVTQDENASKAVVVVESAVDKDGVTIRTSLTLSVVCRDLLLETIEAMNELSS